MTKQITILMVDDEQRFRDTTKKILSKKGFGTILAQSGEEALLMLNQNPDVVILDIRMPGMDGHEALKAIKKMKPDLPVIMLTGHGDKPSAKEALVEGAFDYLSKPCDINILAEKIKEAYHFRNRASSYSEVSVQDVMIPIEEYTVLNEKRTIKDAIVEIKKSFSSKIATNQLMETGHRSIIVVDDQSVVKGILTIRDLLEMVMPEYLNAPKPSMADSMTYSPMFWKGLFSKGIKQIKDKSISDVMSPSPNRIDCEANLMEAAYMMVFKNERRLIVTKNGKTAGIIREQDMFFEMERIINS